MERVILRNMEMIMGISRRRFGRRYSDRFIFNSKYKYNTKSNISESSRSKRLKEQTRLEVKCGEKKHTVAYNSVYLYLHLTTYINYQIL